jgi:hypothetical protein
MNQKQPDQNEEGLEIPFERISPDTLRKMIEEFVTREWADPADSGHTLEDKVSQVLGQLETRTARVVYDVTTETWNIVAAK